MLNLLLMLLAIFNAGWCEDNLSNSVTYSRSDEANNYDKQWTGISTEIFVKGTLKISWNVYFWADATIVG